MQTHYLAQKQTILIPSGACKHLHIVCSNSIFYPNLVKDCVLIVNISTIIPESHYDQTCILSQEDHSFVRHPSYVYYLKADIFGTENITRNIADGTFNVHETCSDEIFNKILNGFVISDEVKPKILKFYKKYCIS